MDVTQLALTWVGWPNGEKLALTCMQFDLDQSEHKLSQVNASARKASPNRVAIGHVRYINILTWLRGFQVKLLHLVLFSLYPSLFWELRYKRNLKNLQFWPESLGAMLEYWYIERGLFKNLVATQWLIPGAPSHSLCGRRVKTWFNRHNRGKRYENQNYDCFFPCFWLLEKRSVIFMLWNVKQGEWIWHKKRCL